MVQYFLDVLCPKKILVGLRYRKISLLFVDNTFLEQLVKSNTLHFLFFNYTIRIIYEGFTSEDKYAYLSIKSEKFMQMLDEEIIDVKKWQRQQDNIVDSMFTVHKRIQK